MRRAPAYGLLGMTSVSRCRRFSARESTQWSTWLARSNEEKIAAPRGTLLIKGSTNGHNIITFSLRSRGAEG
jgi:hypothetical protein